MFGWNASRATGPRMPTLLTITRDPLILQSALRQATHAPAMDGNDSAQEARKAVLELCSYREPTATPGLELAISDANG